MSSEICQEYGGFVYKCEKYGHIEGNFRLEKDYNGTIGHVKIVGDMNNTPTIFRYDLTSRAGSISDEDADKIVERIVESFNTLADIPIEELKSGFQIFY